MNENNTIEKIPFNDSPESQEAQQRLCEIRFECLVKMFDVSNKARKSGGLLNIIPPKPYPPQLFKLQTKLTMEEVKYMDEYQLGSLIKKAYKNLEDHIKQYEDQC